MPCTGGQGNAVRAPDIRPLSQGLQHQLPLSAMGTCMHSWGLSALSVGGGLGKGMNGRCCVQRGQAASEPRQLQSPCPRFQQPSSASWPEAACLSPHPSPEFFTVTHFSWGDKRRP